MVDTYIDLDICQNYFHGILKFIIEVKAANLTLVTVDKVLDTTFNYDMHVYSKLTTAKMNIFSDMN